MIPGTFQCDSHLGQGDVRIVGQGTGNNEVEECQNESERDEEENDGVERGAIVGQNEGM